jgi:hypothetical protein
MQHRCSWETNSMLSEEIPPRSAETKASLQCPQEFDGDPYTEPAKSSPHPQTLFP